MNSSINDIDKQAFIIYGIPPSDPKKRKIAERVNEEMRKQAKPQKVYKPTGDTGYCSFEVWTSKEDAAEDCECSVNDIEEYDVEDIKGFIIVR